jgi:hypothetical protein
LFSDQEDNNNSTDAGIYKVKPDDYQEIFVTVEMDGKSVKMEVDTGSKFSWNTVEKFWSTCATFSLILPCMLILTYLFHCQEENGSRKST